MTDKELNDMVYSDNPWERARAARNGYGLDILMLDKAPMVRPDVRPINLEEAIDFHTLGRNILDAGLINVTYYKGCVYVLPDLK